MAERLTRAELAKHFGVSVSRIQQLVGDGRLLEERGTIDLEQAEQVWDDMDPGYLARVNAQKQRKEADGKVSQAFNIAKARKEAAKAQEAELDLKIKQGKYVDRQVVEQQAYAMAKLFLTKCSGIGRQLAPSLALEKDPAKIEHAVQSAIDTAIAEIRNGTAELAGRTDDAA